MGASREFDFFPTALEVRLPTDFHTKWLKRRGFTQGCAYCSRKIATFHTPWSPGPQKVKSWQIFGLDLAFNIRLEVREREHRLFFIGAQ